jgi:hypothetical protein
LPACSMMGSLVRMIGSLSQRIDKQACCPKPSGLGQF